MGVSPWEQTMRLALARRQAGDEDGAQAAARIVRRNQAAFRAEGLQWVVTHRTEAVLAAFEHDPDRVVAALKLALQRPDPLFFDDPIFEEVRSDPRVIIGSPCWKLAKEWMSGAELEYFNDVRERPPLAVSRP
jgi:hypothetical protein